MTVHMKKFKLPGPSYLDQSPTDKIDPKTGEIDYSKNFIAMLHKTVKSNQNSDDESTTNT